MSGTVFVYLALLFPVLMLFALLLLERLEDPVRVDQLGYDLDAFLASARPEEVETFVSTGYAEALDRYWRRRGVTTHH